MFKRKFSRVENKFNYSWTRFSNLGVRKSVRELTPLVGNSKTFSEKKNVVPLSIMYLFCNICFLPIFLFVLRTNLIK